MWEQIRRLDERVGRASERTGVWAKKQSLNLGTLFLIALLAGVLSYGIDLFNLSVSLDEEAQSTVRGGVIQWVHQDRWAMYLINAFVLPTPMVPFISVLMGIVGLALSAVLAIELWGGGRDARSYAAAAVIVATPVLVFLMHFNTTQYGAFIGMAAGLAGVRLFVAGGWRSILVGWVLVVFALSVYQSIGMAVLCAYLFHALNTQIRHPSREGSLRGLIVRPLGFAVWLAAGAVGHKLSSMLARRLAADDGAYPLVDQAYAGLYWQWYRIERVIEYINFYLLGEKWYLGWPTAAIVYGGVFLIVTRLVYRERASLGLVVGLLTLALAVVTPFLLVIATGVTFWPTRTLLGFPVLLGGLVFTALGTRSKMARIPFWGITAVCLVGFIISNNRLLYADQQQWVLDRQLIFEIQQRLEVAGMPRDRVTMLAIVGTRRFDPSPGRFEEETIAMSFFSPRMPVRQSNLRIARIMQVFGSSNIYGITTPDLYRRAMDASRSMGVWPADGSIAFVDNIAVVKLSEPLAEQIKFANP